MPSARSPFAALGPFAPFTRSGPPGTLRLPALPSPPTLLLPLSLLWILALASPAPSAPPELPGVRRIDGDEVKTLLPPDAIPALEGGEFVPAAEAGFLSDDEPVLGVVRNGVAKAYSLWHLDRHEIVNDDFADEPLAVTW